MKNKLVKFLQEEEGLTKIEYIIDGGVVVTAAVIGFMDFGGAGEKIVDWGVAAGNFVTGLGDAGGVLVTNEYE